AAVIQPARARDFAGPVDIDAQHRYGRTDMAERSACLAPVTGVRRSAWLSGDSPWGLDCANRARASRAWQARGLQPDDVRDQLAPAPAAGYRHLPARQNSIGDGCRTQSVMAALAPTPLPNRD